MSMPYSVTQLTVQIRHLLEAQSTLRDIWLEGEVSNFKRTSAGHCYFTLKDSNAAMACVMWRSVAQWLPRLPSDGEHVLAHGYVSLYEAQGKVQFYADRIDAAGQGRLYQELERLKTRLAAEGLFDEERKRPLPRWPRRIGVVTSPGAAAWRDILRIAAARYPLAEVLLAPTQVQGVEAPAQIVAAIELLNTWARTAEPIDLLIVARGGGSVEELWAFNDERVVRAVAASAIPVISGVGHETDVTLVDFAADVRAPTPSAAAMQALPDRQDGQGQVRALAGRSSSALAGRLAAERQRVAQVRRVLKQVSPQGQLASRRQRVDELRQHKERVMQHALSLRRAQLAGQKAHLASLDPRAVLARGYAIVRREASGEIVTSARQVDYGDRLKILVSDGELTSVAIAD